MTKVFIDGEAGTTGLQIKARLEAMITTVELLQIDPAHRKDPAAKRHCFEQADVVILCLHDDAARASIAMINAMQAQGERIPRVIDASTAHRCEADWVYGFAQLDDQQAMRIAQAQRVANPGCYATGAIALLKPLISLGLLSPDVAVCLPAVSGYSGGGRGMIEQYEQGQASAYEAYALGLQHKHVPEIMRYTGLTKRPLFMPAVGHFDQGMLVSLPLHLDQMAEGVTPKSLLEAYEAYYAFQTTPWIKVYPAREDGKLNATDLKGDDGLELYVFGNTTHHQAVVMARLDNLGKGASGAAVQNLWLMVDGS